MDADRKRRAADALLELERDDGRPRNERIVHAIDRLAATSAAKDVLPLVLAALTPVEVFHVSKAASRETRAYLSRPTTFRAIVQTRAADDTHKEAPLLRDILSWVAVPEHVNYWQVWLVCYTLMRQRDNGQAPIDIDFGDGVQLRLDPSHGGVALEYAWRERPELFTDQLRDLHYASFLRTYLSCFGHAYTNDSPDKRVIVGTFAKPSFSRVGLFNDRVVSIRVAKTRIGVSGTRIATPRAVVEDNMEGSAPVNMLFAADLVGVYARLQQRMRDNAELRAKKPSQFVDAIFMFHSTVWNDREKLLLQQMQQCFAIHAAARFVLSVLALNPKAFLLNVKAGGAEYPIPGVSKIRSEAIEIELRDKIGEDVRAQ